MRPRFIAAECAPVSDALAQNPARGWYRMYTLDLAQGWDGAALAADDGALCLLRADLGAYRERELDAAGLASLGDALADFRAHGKTVILRGVYDVDGRGMEHEPQRIELVEHHIAQLGRVVAAHTGTVLAFQGLLIGSWGEMHNSRYTGRDSLRRLWRAVELAIPAGVWLAVRQPSQWRMLHAEGDTTDRTGLFNDALLSSGTELGTFGTAPRTETGWNGQWLPQEELAFSAALVTAAPYGGETVGPAAAAMTPGQVIHALRERRVSYLNQDWDPQVIKAWKAAPCGVAGRWAGASLFDYLRAHLGYRFSVSQVQFRANPFLRRGKMSFVLKNEGTARFYRTARLEAATEKDDGSREGRQIPVDVSKIGPGEQAEIVLELPVIPGSVWLSLTSVEDDMPVRFANSGSEADGRLLLGQWR